MDDLHFLSHLKNWGQTMVNLHNDLTHFVYGREDELSNHVKTVCQAGEWTLFMEWVPTRYRDYGGNTTVEFLQPMLITRNNPGINDEIDQAIDQANAIFRDIFLRARKERFIAGNIFSLDNQQVTPIYDNRFGVGAACDLRIGDSISIAIDSTKWSDNYAG